MYKGFTDLYDHRGRIPPKQPQVVSKNFRSPKPAPDADFVSAFRITETAFEEIKNTLGKFPAETGGLLLGDPKTGVITDFLFDEDARTTGVIYYPTVDFLNREIPRFEKKGKYALGIAHSHPRGMIRPSGPDLSAAYNNITSPHNSYLKTWHLPIIQSNADGAGFQFHPYITSCSGLGETKLHEPMLEIVDASGKTIKRIKPASVSRAGLMTPAPAVVNSSRISWAAQARLNTEYARVSGQIDFKKLLDTSIIQIGVGASSTTIEHLARLGIKRWVLFDPDSVEKKNLAVQNFEVSDVGKTKVQAMKERLSRSEFEKGAIDVPTLDVDTFLDFLEPDDNELDKLIRKEKRNFSQVILVAATDSFPAQARAARVGIRHSLPTFFVGVYGGGLAGELMFHYPAKTDMPCFRCIAASRYEHNLGKGHRPEASKSSGLPFAVSILDAQLAHLVIGAIHYTSTDKYQANVYPTAELFGELVSENRNFIQSQFNPKYRMAGEDIFRDENGVHGPNVKTFISLFQRDVKNPDCPDCKSPKAWSHTDYRKEQV